MIELRDDDHWYPVKDKCIAGREHTIDNLEELIFPLVNYRGTAIQAGGAVGKWPNKMAEHFQRVVTFEPNPELFQCMTRNCTAPNIEMYSMGIGDMHQMVSLGYPSKPENYGAYHVVGPGDIEIRTIDSFDFPECDLLMLDIEGYELYAFKGAEQLIRRCHPVIVYEAKEICSRVFGYSQEAIQAFLRGCGYTKFQKVPNDADIIATLS